MFGFRERRMWTRTVDESKVFKGQVQWELAWEVIETIGITITVKRSTIKSYSEQFSYCTCKI